MPGHYGMMNGKSKKMAKKAADKKKKKKRVACSSFTPS